MNYFDVELKTPGNLTKACARRIAIEGDYLKPGEIAKVVRVRRNHLVVRVGATDSRLTELKNLLIGTK